MALAAVVLLAHALPVCAQDGAQGQKLKAGEFRLKRVGGAAADSTQWMLQFDADGNLKTVNAAENRDYTSSPVTLIGPSTVGPGASITSAAAASLGEYTSLMVMVSWNTAAAADSDSVAVGLTFIGKKSTDANDGVDFTLAIRDTARFARVDTTVTYGTSQFKTHNCYVIAQRKPPYSAVGTGTAFNCKPTGVIGPDIYTIPPERIIFSDGRNGVCFNLTDAGAPLKFSHLMVQVQNLAGTVTYTNVKVEVWPKVN